jgi:HEAT repeat protein
MDRRSSLFLIIVVLFVAIPYLGVFTGCAESNGWADVDRHRIEDNLSAFGFSDNSTVDREAFDSVVAAGSLAVEPLLRTFINKDDIWVKAEICLALAEIGDVSAVPHLIKYLDQKEGSHFFVRQYIVYALGELRDRRATEKLINELTGPELVYVHKIERTDRKKSIILQNTLLAGHKPHIPFFYKEGVIEALQKIGDPEVLPIFYECLGNKKGFGYLEDDLRKAIREIEKEEGE